MELQPLYQAILNGDQKEAVAITQAAIEAGIDPEDIVHEYMISAMDEVGRRFENNEFFVPELLIAARAMKSSLELLRPLLVESGAKSAGRVAVGTVKGDLHDIGKNLVAAMLEGAGFEVIDLGVDVSAEQFVEAVTDQQAEVICLSALLTTTMAYMRATIDALAEAGVRDQVKVLIGGAPITQKFADDIGADGYGDNASAAVAQARQLIA
ncbi:MAG: corrinoid protein [Pirellulaceae bacterium]|jgi:corrinoid protein of di/trimethylamine methyltransferase|nr:corrinoid protein [Pirellulaceae bacterium]